MKHIPIFFAVDNNYAPNLSVVIESIKENSSLDYIYDIYVLNENISTDYINKLLEYNDDNITITFCDVTEKLKEINEKLPTRDYYSNAIFYRLLIPELFLEFDKALYLDADIIVLDDISKLYNHDVSNFYLGVVKDDVASSCEEFKTYTKEALGVDSTKYFNSGILVMNLLKFRQDKMLDKFINLLKQIKFYVAPDQDYLNILCLDNVLYLSEDWNKAPLKGVVLDDNVKLVHFKLTAKPWHYENIQAGDLFWKYAKRTKFYDILHNTLINYSEEQIKKDNLVEINLIKFAVEETKRIKKIRNEKQLY